MCKRASIQRAPFRNTTSSCHRPSAVYEPAPAQRPPPNWWLLRRANYPASMAGTVAVRSTRAQHLDRLSERGELPAAHQQFAMLNLVLILEEPTRGRSRRMGAVFIKDAAVART